MGRQSGRIGRVGDDHAQRPVGGQGRESFVQALLRDDDLAGFRQIFFVGEAAPIVLDEFAVRYQRHLRPPAAARP